MIRFDRIAVMWVNGTEFDPRYYIEDEDTIEWIEQESVPYWYVSNLFNALWETGMFSDDIMREMENLRVCGMSYDGKEYLIGKCGDFAIDYHTHGGKAYE